MAAERKVRILLGLNLGLAAMVGVGILRTPLKVDTATPQPPVAPDASPSDQRPQRMPKFFGPEDLESTNYIRYLARLGAAGCPPERIPLIVAADVDEVFSRERIELALVHDFEWWHAEPSAAIDELLAEKTRSLATRRELLLQKLAGSPAQRDDPWAISPLTGLRLGALPPKTQANVREKWAELIRTKGYASPGLDSPRRIELARAEQRLRFALAEVLSTEQCEEFLLRYSENARNLRAELRGLKPDADEFRKIFQAVDSMDLAVQLEYGGPEALGENQRQRFFRDRNQSIAQALSSERYRAYLADTAAAQ